jgi:hypothetical protein
MGACVACGEEICRGDAFIVNVAGPIMHIGECVQAFIAGFRVSSPPAPSSMRIADDSDPF